MINTYVVCNIVLSLWVEHIKKSVMEPVEASCKVVRYLGIEGMQSDGNKSYIVDCMDDPSVKQLIGKMGKIQREHFNDYSAHIVTEEDCEF